jgi:hypothetical protein
MVIMALYGNNKVFRSMQVDTGSKTPYSDATQVSQPYLMQIFVSINYT